MSQSLLFDYLPEEKTGNPDAPKPVVTVPIKVSLSRQNKEKNNVIVQSKQGYDTEYLCQQISKNLSVFDIRSWPRGINRKEFDTLWENNFEPKADDPWFAGHFALAVREARRLFRADKEKVWDYILINKRAQLEEWIQIYRRDAENHWKTSNAHDTPEETEYWLKHCHTTWSELNAVLRELELPEEPLPEKYKFVICDPMTWGDEKKPEKVKAMKKGKETAQTTSIV